LPQLLIARGSGLSAPTLNRHAALSSFAAPSKFPVIPSHAREASREARDLLLNFSSSISTIEIELQIVTQVAVDFFRGILTVDQNYARTTEISAKWRFLIGTHVTVAKSQLWRNQ
jgi:hypothetical protein